MDRFTPVFGAQRLRHENLVRIEMRAPRVGWFLAGVVNFVLARGVIETAVLVIVCVRLHRS